MIFYFKKNNIKKQIKKDREELNIFINYYNKNIYLYNTYINKIDCFVEKNIINYERAVINLLIEIKKIKNMLIILTELENICESQNKRNIKKIIKKYNKGYNIIKNNYMNNSILEQNNFINIIENFYKTEEYSSKIQGTKFNIENNPVTQKSNSIENNDTLLISETLGKVILPYTAKEVETIMEKNNDKYQNLDDVIESEFTKKLTDYKIQSVSRYKEAFKLAKEREKYSFKDAISLGAEMFGKKYLHPAIISACKNLDELDVYLDCLEKNELEDFKIFKIKYELYPMVTKNKRKYKNIKKALKSENTETYNSF